MTNISFGPAKGTRVLDSPLSRTNNKKQSTDQKSRQSNLRTIRNKVKQNIPNGFKAKNHSGKSLKQWKTEKKTNNPTIKKSKWRNIVIKTIALKHRKPYILNKEKIAEQSTIHLKQDHQACCNVIQSNNQAIDFLKQEHLANIKQQDLLIIDSSGSHTFAHTRTRTVRKGFIWSDKFSQHSIFRCASFSRSHLVSEWVSERVIVSALADM